MKENIIAKLTVKDDKCACAFADKIISESQETDNGTNILMTLHRCLIIQNHW